MLLVGTWVNDSRSAEEYASCIPEESQSYWELIFTLSKFMLRFVCANGLREYAFNFWKRIFSAAPLDSSLNICKENILVNYNTIGRFHTSHVFVLLEGNSEALADSICEVTHFFFHPQLVLRIGCIWGLKMSGGTISRINTKSFL